MVGRGRLRPWRYLQWGTVSRLMGWEAWPLLLSPQLQLPILPPLLLLTVVVLILLLLQLLLPHFLPPLLMPPPLPPPLPLPLLLLLLSQRTCMLLQWRWWAA